ncbi:MAG: glutaminyl-peptide cyclotransferase [Candidatus Thalassarchaeaceae archaeon]|jgi:glutamine cyclotransferase|nr:glutaminyl-peptide cyclotransferase [Candidatus Thalassarchaeaceae archaeon]
MGGFHNSDISRIRAAALLLTAMFTISIFPTNVANENSQSSSVRPEQLLVEIVETIPHDSDAYTQGLTFYNGRLFESTGLYGSSSLREVNPDDGNVSRIVALNESIFGEGIAFVGNEIIMLTWKNGTAFRFESETFDELTNYSYDGEGWGLCHDGNRLVMSDGSDKLIFRNESTFEIIESVNVTLNGTPRDKLNELECIDGLIFANVYHSDTIVAIDPGTGVVVMEIDASSLRPNDSSAEALNGIAWDEQNQELWVTGKKWPSMYRINLTTPPSTQVPDTNTPGIEVENTAEELSLSTVFLVILALSATGLFLHRLAQGAMNLKDGERDP